jgi:polyphosphate kinase
VRSSSEGVITKQALAPAPAVTERSRRRPPARRSDRYLNRELSWLDFNRRVLALAADDAMPLLERVKLCSIVSSNLDEFVGVRIARLEQLVTSGNKVRVPDGSTPAETLVAARRRPSSVRSSTRSSPTRARHGISTGAVCGAEGGRETVRRWSRRSRRS